MKKSFLILAASFMLGIILSACTNANAGNNTENTSATEPTQATQQATEEVTEKPTEKPTQPPTEEETAAPTQPPTDSVNRNSNTDGQINNFEYLSKNRISGLSYKGCSYDDIVTCYLKNDTNSQNMHYLVDFKNGKIYSAKNPGRWYATEDYSCIKDLTIQEIKDIKNVIKNADTQSWQAEDKGSNGCCNRLSTILVEYKNGAVEEHKVACCGCGTNQGFKTILETVCNLAGNNQCNMCGKVHAVCNNPNHNHNGGNNQYVCNTHCGCNNHNHHHHHHTHTHYCYTVYCYEYTYC